MGSIGVPLVLAMSLTFGALPPDQVPDSVRMAANAQPLFASHEPLEMTVEGPLSRIFGERSQDPREFAARVIETGDAGNRIHDVDIRTRGNARLRRNVCAFPPLRLDFDREEVAGSVFAGQNRLKLVSHCQSGRSEYEQHVLQEYLAYRVFNLMTDASFRVRLARATYVDTDQPRDTLIRWAFLIEDDDLMAARNGVEVVDAPAVAPAVVDPTYLALVEVFQYMVGNPDWSAFAKGPDEDECCHNTQPIGDPDSGPVLPVPYDFDVTGLVFPRHADRVFSPSERNLGIRSVRQRLFRGFCFSQRLWPDAFASFNEKREALYALYRDQPDLEPEVRDRSLEYLDEFYETINDERRVERELRQKCRG